MPYERQTRPYCQWHIFCKLHFQINIYGKKNIWNNTYCFGHCWAYLCGHLYYPEQFQRQEYSCLRHSWSHFLFCRYWSHTQYKRQGYLILSGWLLLFIHQYITIKKEAVLTIDCLFLIVLQEEFCSKHIYNKSKLLLTPVTIEILLFVW